ncbi:MAG TPA: hypothetical protein PLR41_07770 [Alphaproteobacteria bacterium]|nr:hypothetical protein [Alphaproteobacteria bacterium]
MILAEYIRRDRNVPWELFRQHGRQDWVSDQDVMVANLGCTMKIGPEPHYMCWWKIASIARMDEWEDYFRTPEGKHYAATSPVPRALDFYQAGLYDEVFGEGQVPDGLHLVEFFAADDASSSAVRDYFTRRFPAGGRLVYVLKRLGLMAPDPGGIALWTFPSYVAAEGFLRASAPAGPVRVTAAGLYRNFGDDIP